MESRYDVLKLENQLCFPLYACSREVIKRYKPYLDELELTYTQYVTMMVFWEQKEISVKDLGKKLHLDSGTLTPVLKSLEKKYYITRNRSSEDERVLLCRITDEGFKLREKAADVPGKLMSCVRLDNDDAMELYRILNKLLNNF